MASTRRRFLAGVGTALLGGCTGTRDDATLRMESLDVAGSSGGTVAVTPPGRVVLLEFFATWCPRCAPQMSVLNEVRDQFSGDELAMRSLTAERKAETVREYWRTYDGTWPVLLDREMEAYSEYEAGRLPTIVVLSPDGEQVFRHTGYAYREPIQSAIADALDGGP